MGNGIPPGDGLEAALKRCAGRGQPNAQVFKERRLAGEVAPPPTGFLFSLLSFLAVLSQELPPGGQGLVVVAARPRAADGSWRERLAEHVLRPPTMCLQSAGGEDCGLNDFMAGGNDFQAMTDIA